MLAPAVENRGREVETGSFARRRRLGTAITARRAVACIPPEAMPDVLWNYLNVIGRSGY